MSDEPREEETVTVRRAGRVGRLTLNRPRALNALDPPMIARLARAVAAWRDDPSVHAVVLDAAGGRAFCAGGDVRALRDHALARDADAIEAFFAAEYALNLAIATFGKPWISLIDGVCMGGGLGVSVHGAVRVVTEAAAFAMPETAIALFPDVGMSHVLPRLPGALGTFLGLTGTRLAGADAVHAGFGTHFVTRACLPDLTEALVADGVTAVAAFAEELPLFSLAPHRVTIDRCFALPTVPAILDALASDGSPFARETTETLRLMSPSALAWSLRLLRDGAGRTLAQCLEAELALTRAVTMHPDFAEGVRAVVVDKDRAPRWSPPAIEDLE